MSELQVSVKFNVGMRVFFFQRTKETSVPLCGDVVGVLPVVGEAGREESYVLDVRGSKQLWVVPVSRIYSASCDIILACQQEGFSRGVEFVPDAAVSTFGAPAGDRDKKE